MKRVNHRYFYYDVWYTKVATGATHNCCLVKTNSQPVFHTIESIWFSLPHEFTITMEKYLQEEIQVNRIVGKEPEHINPRTAVEIPVIFRDYNKGEKPRNSEGLNIELVGGAIGFLTQVAPQ